VIGLRHLFTSGNTAFFDRGGIRLMLAQAKVSSESILYFRGAKYRAHTGGSSKTAQLS
jgi:hypothetical protein